MSASRRCQIQRLESELDRTERGSGRHFQPSRTQLDAAFRLKGTSIVVVLETQLGAKLKLERIEGVPRSVETQDGVWRQAEICSAVERIQVLDVGAVEDVEEIGAQLE